MIKIAPAADSSQFVLLDGMADAQFNVHIRRAARESRKMNGEPTSENIARVVDMLMYGWRTDGQVPTLPPAMKRPSIATGLLAGLLRRL